MRRMKLRDVLYIGAVGAIFVGLVWSVVSQNRRVSAYEGYRMRQYSANR